MKKQIAIFFLFCFALTSAWAEEIIIPVGQQGGENIAMEKPRHGILKEAVLNQFGEPLSKQSAVGEPPISSWEYDHYTVYFEYDHVLHAVLKPVGQQTTR